MASDVREYLRAAQAAEIRGDNARAVELLRTAAGAYQEAGNHPRAEQMLRHAQRLEARPSAPPSPAKVPDKRSGSMSAARTSVGWAMGGAESGARRPRAADLELVERGPALADPAAPAWCSFCCRPRDEVGRLVAGPAGAFICATCVAQSASLLGAASISTTPPATARDGLPVRSSAHAPDEPIATLRAALRSAADALSATASCLETLRSGPGGQQANALVDRLPKGASTPSNAARSRTSIKKKRRR